MIINSHQLKTLKPRLTPLNKLFITFAINIFKFGVREDGWKIEDGVKVEGDK